MADMENVASTDLLEYEEDDLGLAVGDGDHDLSAAKDADGEEELHLSLLQTDDGEAPAGDQRDQVTTNTAAQQQMENSGADDVISHSSSLNPATAAAAAAASSNGDPMLLKREPKHELDEVDAELDPSHIEEMSRKIDRAIVEDVLGPDEPQHESSGSGSDSESGEESQSEESSSAESGEERESEGEASSEDEESTSRRSSEPPKRKRRRQKTCADSRDVRWFFTDARFFLIKSANAENVSLSKAKGVWATTAFNQRMLTQRFKDTRNVILVFSVERSGSFQGFARLGSPAELDHSPVNWVLPPNMDPTRLGGIFRLQWLCRKPLPFDKTMHLINPLNENRPVKIGRDGTEIQHNVGRALCELFSLDEAIDHPRLIKKAQVQQQHGEHAFKRPHNNAFAGTSRAHHRSAPDVRRGARSGGVPISKRVPLPPLSAGSRSSRSTVLASGRIGKLPSQRGAHRYSYNYPPPPVPAAAPVPYGAQPYSAHYAYPPSGAPGQWYPPAPVPLAAVGQYAAATSSSSSSGRRRAHGRDEYYAHAEPEHKRHRSSVVVVAHHHHRQHSSHSPPRAYKRHHGSSRHHESSSRSSGHSRHRDRHHEAHHEHQHHREHSHSSRSSRRR